MKGTLEKKLPVPIIVLLILSKLSHSFDSQHCKELVQKYEPRNMLRNEPFSYGDTVKSITLTCEQVTLDQQLPPRVHFCLTCDKIVEIKNSNITVIPPSKFVELSDTSTLLLRDIGTEKVMPGAFNSLVSLERLDMSNNNLSELYSGVFNSLEKLKHLDLSCNRINNLSEHVFTGTAKLEELNVSSNALTVVDKSFFIDLKRLVTLDASQNQLTSFDLSEMPSTIVQLVLSKNKLKKLVGCHTKNVTSACSNLNTLDLSFNLIANLKPDALKKLNVLRFLKLEYNSINSIPHGCFSDLTSLVFLNLSHNHLEQIQYGLFDSLFYLRTLDLSNNDLSAFDKHNFHALFYLEELYLSNNKITVLDAQFLLKQSPHLKFIALDKNYFSCDELLDIVHTIKRQTGYVHRGSSVNATNIYGNLCLENITRKGMPIEGKADPPSYWNYNSGLLETVIVLLVILIFVAALSGIANYVKSLKMIGGGKHEQLELL